MLTRQQMLIGGAIAMLVVILVIVMAIITIAKKEGYYENNEIIENFPQSSMNVLYSDASGNLSSTSDLGVQYLSAVESINSPAINRIGSVNNEWFRINERSDSVGRTALYGGVAINSTRGLAGGLVVGDWDPNAGTGNIRATGSVKAGSFETTNNGSINAGTGSLTAGASTLGTLTCGAITTGNKDINAGTGTLTAGTSTLGTLTCGSITTNNNIINAGTGAITCGPITSSGAIIGKKGNTERNLIDEIDALKSA